MLYISVFKFGCEISDAPCRAPLVPIYRVKRRGIHGCDWRQALMMSDCLQETSRNSAIPYEVSDFSIEVGEFYRSPVETAFGQFYPCS